MPWFTRKKHSSPPKLVIVRSSNTFFGCGCSFSRAIWSGSHFSRCRPARTLPRRNVLHPLMRGHETNMAAVPVHSNKLGRAAQRRITHNDYPMQRDQWCWTSARGCLLRSGSSARGRGNSSRQLCVPLPSQGVLFLFYVWMRSPNPNDRVRFEFGLKFIPTQLAKLYSDEVSVINENSSVVDLSKPKKK